MSDYSLCGILMCGILLCECAVPRQNRELSAESIIGKWESDVGPGELGRSLTQIEFRGDGTVIFRAVFVDDSPPTEMTHKGTYQVLGNMLTSDAMYKGEPLRVWFDRGDLMMQMDDEASDRLHRVH